MGVFKACRKINGTIIEPEREEMNNEAGNRERESEVSRWTKGETELIIVVTDHCDVVRK